MTTTTPVRRSRGRSKGSPAMRGETSILRTIGIVAVWIAVALGILMLIWMVLQSVRSTRDILTDPFGLPTTLVWENYATAWTRGNFGVAVLNSTITTLVASAVTVAIAAPAAYYFARVDTPLTRGLTLYFIIGLGIPAQVILIPLFVMLAQVNLTDSLVGLNIVYIGTSLPFTVFLLVAFFRSIPEEVEEAAAIDGASPIKSIVLITLPLAKGGILTAFILQVISNWNETLLAMALLTSSSKYTLPVALISFIQQQTYAGANYAAQFAGICMIVLPMLGLYLWIGTRLTQGLTVGMGK